MKGVYGLQNPQVGTTRNGKPYLKCIIRDATGDLVCRKWSFEEGSVDALGATGFVYVEGHTQIYNGQVQFIVETIRSQEVTELELRSLLPTTKKDIEVMFGEVKGLLESLEHPAMKALAAAYLNDEGLMANFRLCPAAMSLHHAWIGGLLEHTLQVMKLAEAMLPLYPTRKEGGLNRDMILLGLFLHDLGKTTELTWDRGFNYTTEGNLIGHVVKGAIWLQFKAAMAAKESGHKLPADALRVMQHIIVSHHGEPEFGAAKIPATPEAVFISMLDNLDAKTQLALTNAQRDSIVEGAGAFTDKVWALGNVRLFRQDPLSD